MAARRPERYQTHFYCSLCGGPFAQVFRTCVPAQNQPESWEKDVSSEGRFNIAEDENAIIPPEIWMNDMGPIAQCARKGRGDVTTRTVREAYDGTLISVQQMEWSMDLRALIHRHSTMHPQMGHPWTGVNAPPPVGEVYLTGRGLVKCHDNLGYAFPSFEDPDDDDDGSTIPQFPPWINPRFYLYQDAGSVDFFLSSIPFHEECSTLLERAIEVSAQEIGFEPNSYFAPEDDIWHGLREFLGGEPDMKKLSLSSNSLLPGEERKEVVTRLGEINYREAQGCGEGWKWRHEDGLHWLLANPSIANCDDIPLEEMHADIKERHRTSTFDPFSKLPAELVYHIFSYLTSTDVYSLRMASPAVAVNGIHPLIFKRFLFEEYQHSFHLIKKFQQAADSGQVVNWRGIFQYLRRSTYVSNPTSTDRDCWKGVDISLKNRNRIWKVIKPLAEYIVSTSSEGLEMANNASATVAHRTSVPRGLFGNLSGKPGQMQCVYFGPENATEKQCSSTVEGSVSTFLTGIRVWLEPKTGAICGIGFRVEKNGAPIVRRIGARSLQYEDVAITRVNPLAGFIACFTDYRITGIEVVLSKSDRKMKFGTWEGVLRKLIPPKPYRKLVGVIAFVNTCDQIETVGVLEEAQLHDGTRLAPRKIEYRHSYSSGWKRFPPDLDRVRVIDRVGPVISKWRTIPADWEIWDNEILHPEEKERRCKKNKPLPSRYLHRIIAYHDNDFLRGLVFEYKTVTRKEISTIGSTAKKWEKSVFKVDPYETFPAAVISEGAAGIHGLLFLSNINRVTPFFGSRYKGKHTAFNLLRSKQAKESEIVTFISNRIVGLHYVYDEEHELFRQIGLILEKDEDSSAQPSAEVPVPFSVYAMEQFPAVWEESVPDPSLITGCRSVRTNRFDVRAPFAGWVELENVAKIEIFGAMQGIRFTFRDKSRKFFGDISGVEIRKQNFLQGEKITGIAELAKKEGDDCYSLKHIVFISSRNRSRVLRDTESCVESRFLTGIKFLFTDKRLTYWAPLHRVPPSQASEIPKLISPWKMYASDDIFCENMRKPSPELVAYALFTEDGHDSAIDAIKGYVTNSGHFCGMAFRRNGIWDEEIFGDPSGIEIPLEFQKDERILSLMVSYEAQGDNVDYTGVPLPENSAHANKGAPVAISFTTTKGRNTPWLGIPLGRVVEYKPRSGYKTVGICGKLTTHPLLFESLELLYKPCRQGRADSIEMRSLSLSPRPRRLTAGSVAEENTPLQWITDPQLLPNNFTMGEISDENLQKIAEDESLTGFYRPLRTFSIFDPSLLKEFCISSNRGVFFGVQGIAFRGEETMGDIFMGSFPPKDRIDPEHFAGMEINGPAGERINRLRLAFSEQPNPRYVVAVEITTNFGRKGILRSHCASAPANVFEVARNIQHVECPEGEELVGFHAVLNKFNFLEIGSISRPVSPDMPKSTQGDIFKLYENSWSASTKA